MELITSTITIIGAMVGVGVFLMMHIDKRLDALQADIQRVDKKTDTYRQELMEEIKDLRRK